MAFLEVAPELAGAVAEDAAGGTAAGEAGGATRLACRAHFRSEAEGRRFDLAQRIADLIERRPALTGDELTAVDDQLKGCIREIEALS